MTKVIVTSNADETMLVGEKVAREILEKEVNRSIIIFLESLIKSQN